MEKLLLVLNILAILGFPSLFVLVSVTIKKMSKYSEQIKILMDSQQAQMRSQLLKDYYKYRDRGFIYESELQDWKDCYEKYHKLGANGVMDQKYKNVLLFETRAEID